ncbi:M28 family peptidase [Lutispora saccharofermentans]|uniref:M28 family peptidase n=1 Tax=Lutispora saccharofermentans TaxID=3024236 RepID=A0ABT1NCF0_9FIRM|nr:M28 family peptidase [Lutispora saccharofermentans]MCQ1528940.1 M28 family peptidase [Lutispora saccharofermentans]
MKVKGMESKLLASVDPDLLMKHTEYISSFDRESGSEGEWQAARYFEEVMTGYGLDVHVKSIENLISLPISAEITLDDGRKVPCITQSYAVSTEPGGLKGKAVFYPECPDVKGKIAILKGLASPSACYNLERMGALGLIFINGGDYPHNMAISPIWGMPVPETIELLGKIPVVSVTKKNGELLLNYIADESKEILIESEVQAEFKQVPLCIADLKAAMPTNRYILFNGHVDSWHKGATDNATANAAILEIARVLKDYRDKLKINVRFVWWSGHSNGRYSGSNWYADHNWEDIHENAVLNVNIDAIGAGGSTSYRTVDSSAQCFRLGYEVIKEMTGQEPSYSRIQRNGDQSFWGHGVPSLFQILSLQPESAQGKDTFVPGLPWYWHTTEDKFEYVGKEELTLDTKIYLASIWRFVSQAALPFCFTDLGQEILTNLEDWQKAAGEAFDLSPLKEEAAALNQMLPGLDGEISRINKMENLSEADKENADNINDCIMSLNRILIPVHYCSKSLFETDLALPMKPFPGLTDLEKLTAMNRNSLEFKMLERQLIRERNRIFHSFKEAVALIKACNNRSNLS